MNFPQNKTADAQAKAAFVRPLLLTLNAPAQFAQ